MDSDGEKEFVEDGGLKAEPAKVSKVIAVKVSLSISFIFSFKN